MSYNSSLDENEHSRRQGSFISLIDEDEPTTTTTSDSFLKQNAAPLSPDKNLSSSFSNEFSKLPILDDSQQIDFEKEYQIATMDLQSVPDISSHDDGPIEDWKQVPSAEAAFRKRTNSDSTDEITLSFGFQQQEPVENNGESTQQTVPEEVNPTMDYDSLIRSRGFYADPNPEVIKKPQMIAPLVYKQNITIKFLQPPPIEQGPLIIREVREPQPPPPPPLVIRQHPRPPLAPPPPLILREKPPPIPELKKTQIVTRFLPPLPPPPRSVILEKIPPLPPKPRDVIIERWIPYERLTQNREVIVQRAEETKPYPPPRNVIITYDPVPVNIVRQVERLGITPEDPQSYTTRFGDSLLETKDLLAQAKELGIIEDLSPPMLIQPNLQQQLTSPPHDNNSLNNKTVIENVADEKDNNIYTPAYENFVDGTFPLPNSYENNQHSVVGQENEMDTLYTQLAQYGLTEKANLY